MTPIAIAFDDPAFVPTVQGILTPFTSVALTVCSQHGEPQEIVTRLPEKQINDLRASLTMVNEQIDPYSTTLHFRRLTLFG